MAAHDSRIFGSTDMLYLVTFGAGMAAFWLGGHASALLPVLKDHNLAVAASLAITAGIYALGIFIISFLVIRRLGKGVTAGTLVALALGITAAQVIIRLSAGHIHQKFDVAILTFVLYVCYGGIYALSLAVARKLSR